MKTSIKLIKISGLVAALMISTVSLNASEGHHKGVRIILSGQNIDPNMQVFLDRDNDKSTGYTNLDLGIVGVDSMLQDCNLYTAIADGGDIDDAWRLYPADINCEVSPNKLEIVLDKSLKKAMKKAKKQVRKEKKHEKEDREHDDNSNDDKVGNDTPDNPTGDVGDDNDREYRGDLNSKAYMPDIVMDEAKMIYVTPHSLQSKIDNATDGDILILKDGHYNGVKIVGKTNLTLKAENSGKAIFTNGSEANIKIADSSYINIMGLDGSGARYFVFAPSWRAEVHHVYIGDCKIHDSMIGVYSGISSHDWTVDRCEIHDMTRSYGWYSLGYHHTLQNSVLYKINNFYINVRGYTPVGEVNSNSYPHFDHKPLKYRDPSSYERLSSDDWTHQIINNTFGREVDNFTRESHRGAGIGFYIGGKDATDEDEYYLPPQNVLIENNVFYNLHGDSAIFVDGEYGFSKNDPSHGFPILGTVIRNNVTNEKKLLTTQYDPDLSMFELTNNIEGVSNSKLGFKNPNASNPSYELTKKSTLLINKGIEGTSYDINDNRRDEQPDIGAYEY